jgi:hypothetical protein
MGDFDGFWMKIGRFDGVDRARDSSYGSAFGGNLGDDSVINMFTFGERDIGLSLRERTVVEEIKGVH